jgi:hypothetical protein
MSNEVTPQPTKTHSRGARRSAKSIEERYTQEERDNINALKDVLTDDRINMMSVCFDAFKDRYPTWQRISYRSHMHNLLSYRRYFHPGEFKDLHDALMRLLDKLNQVKAVTAMVDVNVKNLNLHYVKDLPSKEYETVLKFIREKREASGNDEFMVPYYVDTPVPYVIDLAIYEYHTRDKEAARLKEGVDNLYELMDLLGVTMEEAKRENYTLKLETLEKLKVKYKTLVRARSLRAKNKLRAEEIMRIGN